MTELYLEIKHRRPKAILVSDGVQKDAWLPLSQITIIETKDDHAEITMQEWLAKEKGFI